MRRKPWQRDKKTINITIWDSFDKLKMCQTGLTPLITRNDDKNEKWEIGFLLVTFYSAF